MRARGISTAKDCAWLAEFVAASRLLRRLELHRSRVDDTRLALLSNALAEHPSLTEISLAYNVLGDDAARVLARHLHHTAPRLTLVSIVNHSSNFLNFIRCLNFTNFIKNSIKFVNSRMQVIACVTTNIL